MYEFIVASKHINTPLTQLRISLELIKMFTKAYFVELELENCVLIN